MFRARIADFDATRPSLRRHVRDGGPWEAEEEAQWERTRMKVMWYGIPVPIIPLATEQRGNGARFAFAAAGKMVLPTEFNSGRVAGEIPHRDRLDQVEEIRCANGGN